MSASGPGNAVCTWESGMRETLYESDRIGEGHQSLRAEKRSTMTGISVLHR
jgi:hypothetical protein